MDWDGCQLACGQVWIPISETAAIEVDWLPNRVWNMAPCVTVQRTVQAKMLQNFTGLDLPQKRMHLFHSKPQVKSQ